MWRHIVDSSVKLKGCIGLSGYLVEEILGGIVKELNEDIESSSVGHG